MPAERRLLSAGVVAALLVVYLVWGSTYLAIRIAIETLPGFTMAAVRFLVAGAILYLWGRRTGGAAPTRAEWLRLAGIGALLLLGGNGGVVWAEHRIGSGVAALLVAIEPVWVALLAPMVIGAKRSGLVTAAGLALGVGGVAALVLRRAGDEATRADPAGAVAVVIASLCWALGSLWSVRGGLPASRTVSVGGQMLAGGAFLAAAGAVTGEWSTIEPGGFSARSITALLYLVTFGSIAAFSAYTYLLQKTPPLVASTYAFVNPLVAVVLGWLFADEAVGARVALATLLILGAVALIFGDELRQKPKPSSAPAAEPEAA